MREPLEAEAVVRKPLVNYTLPLRGHSPTLAQATRPYSGAMISNVVRQTMYWTRVVFVIAISSLILAVVFVSLDQRVGIAAAWIAGIAMAPVFGWAVSKVAKKG